MYFRLPEKLFHTNSWFCMTNCVQGKILKNKNDLNSILEWMSVCILSISST